MLDEVARVTSRLRHGRLSLPLQTLFFFRWSFILFQVASIYCIVRPTLPWFSGIYDWIMSFVSLSKVRKFHRSQIETEPFNSLRSLEQISNICWVKSALTSNTSKTKKRRLRWTVFLLGYSQRYGQNEQGKSRSKKTPKPNCSRS